MISPAINLILRNTSAVTDLVGTNIFPISAPKAVSAPFIVYSQVGANPTEQKDQASPIDRVLIQVDIYSTNYTDSHSIADAVRTALEFYEGTQLAKKIRLINFQSEEDGDFEEAANFYAVSQAYQITYER